MKNTTLLSEQILIAELKQGSKKAFDQIYRMYARRLLAYCLQYVKCKEDAEEIVQDVFIHLWHYREKIRQEETLRSLLFIMSKNYVINAFRSTVNSPIYEDYVNFQNELSIDNINQSLHYKEFVVYLRRQLKLLPSTQQRVIELSKFSCFTNKEIAEKLSLSEQTVKNQLSAGLKALRELLGKEMLICFLLLFC